MADGMAMTELDSEIVLRHARDGAPVDLDAICRDLRLPVSLDRLEGIAGKLERHASSPRGFRIVINDRDPEPRQRFTQAHEIAHFVLHRDLLPEGLVDSALYRSSLSNEYERQADRYAASILLHAETVRREFRAHPSLAHLARLFKVSDAALRIRLKELRLDA